MTTYYSIVTDIGVTKMARAVSLGQKVNITAFAVGDGGGAYYEPTADMTELKEEVWRGVINSSRISEDNENVLVITSVIPSNVGGFTIREMAVFDEEGDMIAICNTPDTQKVRTSEGVVHELSLSMEILLSNTDSVQIVIDPNVVTATKKDVEIAKQEVLESITLATPEEVAAMAEELMNESGGGILPETATDEDIEELIDDLDDL